MHLYSPFLLRHASEPYGAGEIEGATHKIQRSNPLCGDRVRWTLRMEERMVCSAAHITRGCVICIASSSILSQRLIKQNTLDIVGDIERFTQGIERLMVEKVKEESHIQAFAGLQFAPARKECVLLPWISLQELLQQEQ